MKQDKIHDALDLLDDDMVEAVDKLRTKRHAKRKNLRWVSLAACICAAMVAVLVVLINNTNKKLASEYALKK